MIQKKQEDLDEVDELINLIKLGDIQAIEKYLSSNKNDVVNKVSKKLKYPPLYFAVKAHQDDLSLAILKILLLYKVNYHYKDDYSQNILFYICRQGKIKCLDFMITQEGLSLDQVDSFGQSPLYYAVGENMISIVKHYGTKQRVNQVDKILGQTPLFYSAKKGFLQMCKVLIQNGTDLTILDDSKKTAAQYARKGGFNQVADYLQQKMIEPNKLILQTNQKDVLKRQKNGNKESKQFYKIVQYKNDGKTHDLTQAQAKEFMDKYLKLKQYILNPDSISKQQNVVTWQKVAEKILNYCYKVKGSYYFHDPVDPIKLKIKDYNDVIEKPMDLGSIKNKLKYNWYQRPEEFVSEMKLIWQNSYTYNGESHVVSKCAKQLENQFNSKMISENFDKYLASQTESQTSLHT